MTLGQMAVSRKTLPALQVAKLVRTLLPAGAKVPKARELHYRGLTLRTWSPRKRVRDGVVQLSYCYAPADDRTWAEMVHELQRLRAVEALKARPGDEPVTTRSPT